MNETANPLGKEDPRDGTYTRHVKELNFEKKRKETDLDGKQEIDRH